MIMIILSSLSLLSLSLPAEAQDGHLAQARGLAKTLIAIVMAIVVVIIVIIVTLIVIIIIIIVIVAIVVIAVIAAIVAMLIIAHPVSLRRFPSFRTQPPENLSHYL